MAAAEAGAGGRGDDACPATRAAHPRQPPDVPLVAKLAQEAQCARARRGPVRHARRCARGLRGRAPLRSWSAPPSPTRRRSRGGSPRPRPGVQMAQRASSDGTVLPRRLPRGAPKGQALRAILEELVEGLPPGTALPSERELAERYGLARMTVRNEIERLTAEGSVYRLHGRGTFVAEPRIAQAGALTSFTEDMLARGHVPGSTVTSTEVIEADGFLAAALEVKTGDSCFQLDRVRTADGRPMAIERVYLPLAEPGRDRAGRLRRTRRCSRCSRSASASSSATREQRVVAVSMEAEEAPLLERARGRTRRFASTRSHATATAGPSSTRSRSTGRPLRDRPGPDARMTAPGALMEADMRVQPDVAARARLRPAPVARPAAGRDRDRRARIVRLRGHLRPLPARGGHGQAGGAGGAEPSDAVRRRVAPHRLARASASASPAGRRRSPRSSTRYSRAGRAHARHHERPGQPARPLGGLVARRSGPGRRAPCRPPRPSRLSSRRWRWWRRRSAPSRGARPTGSACRRPWQAVLDDFGAGRAGRRAAGRRRGAGRARARLPDAGGARGSAEAARGGAPAGRGVVGGGLPPRPGHGRRRATCPCSR